MIEKENKTKKGQRVAIICIALFMLLSTAGLYISMMIMPGNDKKDAEISAAEQAELQELLNEYSAKVEDQRLELSAKYKDKFSPYKSKVSGYNANNITELKTEDLLIGDGAEITEENAYNYSAYYIGWLSDETIFDSSLNDDDSLKTPISGDIGLIEGWEEGVIGMKMGGVRLLTIPSDKGYGAVGSGESIPANAPLKFIVMVIPHVEEVEIPQKILDYYGY